MTSSPSYQCDKCSYSAGQMGSLKRHIETKHEGIRYPCDLCEFSATRPSDLKTHKDSKHEGIRYPCDHCGYAATRVSDLKRHVKVRHSGIKSKRQYVDRYRPKDKKETKASVEINSETTSYQVRNDIEKKFLSDGRRYTN